MALSDASVPTSGAPRRIAVFSPAQVGAVNAILPIVAKLVERGCDVQYFLADTGMREAVEMTGACFHLWNDFFGQWPALLSEDSAWLLSHGFGADPLSAPPAETEEQPSLAMCFYALPAGVCLARRLLELWEAPTAWRPELVLYGVEDVYPLLVASKLGLPSASLLSWPGPGVQLHMASVPEAEREAWEAALVAHEVVAAANKFAEATFGVNVLSAQLPCRHFNDQLNLVTSIPELGSEVPGYQQRLFEGLDFKWVGYTGCQQHHINGMHQEEVACMHRLASDVNAEDAPWRMPLPDQVRILVVSLGAFTVGALWDVPAHSSPSGHFTGRDFSKRLWSELIEHFRGRHDVRVVMAIGPHPDALEGLGKLPGNFIARRCVAQIDALSRAHAFLTHGGGNGMMEGLMTGNALIVVPFGADQFSNGAAVERTGTGVTFWQPMEAAPGAVAEAADAALWGDVGEDQRAKSKIIGQKLREAGGADAAAEACLQMISGT